ncbi:hypothetical protein D3C73_1541760 [compost metagenome]
MEVDDIGSAVATVIVGDGGSFFLYLMDLCAGTVLESMVSTCTDNANSVHHRMAVLCGSI